MEQDTFRAEDVTNLLSEIQETKIEYGGGEVVWLEKQSTGRQEVLNRASIIDSYPSILFFCFCFFVSSFRKKKKTEVTDCGKCLLLFFSKEPIFPPLTLNLSLS